MATIESYETAKGTRYMVRYRTPDHRITTKRGFKRKRDARDWSATTEVDKLTGRFVDVSAGMVSVGERSGAWLAKKRVGLKRSSFVPLEVSWRVHVGPRWGGVRLSEVSRGDVQEWVNGLAEVRSATVVIRAHSVLAGILDDAVTDRLVHGNSARGVQLPRKRRKRHVYLSAARLGALADACVVKVGRVSDEDEVHRLLVLLLGTTGMRWGEAIGLHGGDVDLKRHRIAVERSATQVNGHIVVDIPKGNKVRSVVFPEGLDGMLRERLDGRAKDDLVFPGTVDGFMRHPSPRGERSWFHGACRRAGIEGMTVHDLRHTAASLMVASGANVKAVQRQLGHASAAMTLDVYADLFDADLDAVGEAMNSVLLQSVLKK